MTSLIVLPIVIPVFTAAVLIFARRRPSVQRLFSLLSLVAQFVVAIALFSEVKANGVQVMFLGAWEAPYGITFAADLLGALMLVTGTFVALCVGVFSLGSVDQGRISFGYHPLFHVMMMGVSGSFLTADAFNLFVWFEVMLISSFVLMTLGGERAQLEGGFKYVTLNLISSSIFLVGLGLLYGTVGTLNFAHLNERIAQSDRPWLALTLSMFFLAAFGIKSAIFPVYSWLPASYHTPPPAVTALFAGLLTKVGAYAILRFFTLVFPFDAMQGYPPRVLTVLAVLTMLFGALGALVQTDLRRALSFMVIASMGFVLTGIAISTQASISASIFYLTQDMVVKSLVFLCAGTIVLYAGGCSFEQVAGLYRRKPLLSTLFFIGAFAIAGLPMTTGFVGKLALASSAVSASAWWLLGAMLVSALILLAAVGRLWTLAFWRELDDGTPLEVIPVGRALWVYGPSVAGAIVVIGIGIYASPALALSDEAARTLLDPAAYVEAVLGR